MLVKKSSSPMAQRIEKPSLSATEESKISMDLSLPRFGAKIEIKEPPSPSSDIVVGEGSPMTDANGITKVRQTNFSHEVVDDSSENDNNDDDTYKGYRTATANFGNTASLFKKENSILQKRRNMLE
jgi:hypothetical protein